MKKFTWLILAVLFASNAFAVNLKQLKVQTRSGLASVLVLENGMTLYVFDPDQGRPAPACAADCAEKWPPILLTPEEEANLKIPGLGSIKRANGLSQLTYKGRPLYTYFADRIPGHAKGDGLGNVWHVALP